MWSLRFQSDTPASSACQKQVKHVSSQLLDWCEAYSFHQILMQQDMLYFMLYFRYSFTKTCFTWDTPAPTHALFREDSYWELQYLGCKSFVGTHTHLRTHVYRWIERDLKHFGAQFDVGAVSLKRGTRRGVKERCRGGRGGRGGRRGGRGERMSHSVGGGVRFCRGGFASRILMVRGECVRGECVRGESVSSWFWQQMVTADCLFSFDTTVSHLFSCSSFRNWRVW